MELTTELIRKHRNLIEAKVTVKGHTRRSKKGKAFNVVQYERNIEDMDNRTLKALVRDGGGRADLAKAELEKRRRAKVGKYGTTDADAKRTERENRIRDRDMVRAFHKGRPDPLSPGQLKKRYGGGVFTGPAKFNSDYKEKRKKIRQSYDPYKHTGNK